jgi:dienelactone hydrolase
MAGLGKPTGQDAPQSTTVQGSVLVTIPVHWPAAALNFLVSWNKDGQIQGTWFRPGDAPKPAIYDSPPYSDPTAFTTREMNVGDLPGTLAIPRGKGPFPALVLVHGSGPHDRDETVGGARPFRDLAEGLASRGIAVLRYDKRTFVGSPGPLPKDGITMTWETVNDAVRAAGVLRSQPDIDPRRIFVLGHSQGGYMVPRIVKADPKFAGAIVLAGNARPLPTLVAEQTEYLAELQGSLSAEQRARVEAVKKDPWSALPGIPESYKRDLDGYDPAALVRTSSVPLLILQGERDYQVTMTDFGLWKKWLAGRVNTDFRSFPNLNHLFVAGEGKSTPAEYERTAHVGAEVVDAIAAWIKAR